MHIDSREKTWIWISSAMLVVMVVVLTLHAVGNNIHPPSNVETVDSTRLHLTGEFAEDKLGVKEDPDGSVTVTMVAARYGFYPQRLEIPAGKPVKIRVASADVLHGLHVPYTNFATMVVPGYVAEVNTRFDRPGEYTIFCNEYCGLGHDQMWSRLVVSGK